MSSQDQHHPKPVSTEEDKKAFRDMLLRNKALIWHVCSDYYIGKAWSTEDCMQEVIYVLWRDFNQFEGKGSEQAWVYRVATNAMLMLKRKSSRSPLTNTLELSDEEAETIDPTKESYQQLLQLIDALPEKEVTTIRAFLDGFSYKEIADMTHSTVGAVAMRIARTKRKLRQMYEKENAYKTRK